MRNRRFLSFFRAHMWGIKSHQISHQIIQNIIKFDPISSKSRPIKIERSQIAQNSNIKNNFFARFSSILSKSPAEAFFATFFPLFSAADKNQRILDKLLKIDEFYMVLPMSTIVSAQIAHFGIFINSSFSAPKQPEMPEKSRWFAAAKSRGFFSYKPLGLRKSSEIHAIIVYYSVISALL